MPADYINNPNKHLHRQTGWVRWPDPKLPPINLYNAPRSNDMTQPDWTAAPDGATHYDTEADLFVSTHHIYVNGVAQPRQYVFGMLSFPRYIPLPKSDNPGTEALPPVGTSNANSSLTLPCVHPQPEVWEVIAHRDSEAVVYVPACPSNGTDQAEVYLMAAQNFQTQEDQRLKDELANLLSTMKVNYHDGSFELFPGPVVDELLARFDVSFKE